MSYKLKKTLVAWAKDDLSRIAQLEAARDEAIEKVLSGKGSQLTSATTNSNTFTVSISMTNEQFASCITDVLDHLENGTTPQNRVVGGFNTYE